MRSANPSASCKKKRQSLFCVADPNFENNNIVTVVEVDYDEDKCFYLLDKSFEFWKTAIFHRLM